MDKIIKFTITKTKIHRTAKVKLEKFKIGKYDNSRDPGENSENSGENSENSGQNGMIILAIVVLALFFAWKMFLS